MTPTTHHTTRNETGALRHERYHIRRCAVSHPFRSRHALYTDHRREAYPEVNSLTLTCVGMCCKLATMRRQLTDRPADPRLSCLYLPSLQGGWRPFPEVAAALSERYKGAVITDAVVQARVTRAEALALLEEHLLRNTVYLPRSGGWMRLIE